MSEQITPGLWTYSEGETDEGRPTFFVDDSDGFTVAEVGRKADAAAFAAVPDLLHACDKAETAFGVVELCDDLPPQVRDAAKEARRLCQDAVAKARLGSAFAETVAVVG